jgi:hypothetical protein
MIDGLLLLIELGLMLLLLRTVCQARGKDSEDDLGFFAYQTERVLDPDEGLPRWQRLSNRHRGSNDA